MKHLYLLLIFILLFSCGNERVLQLPEIENAKITEIRDVSHAYLFYDETKEDSVEINRKNLIITTNWLVNVDKRLTLAQAIPKIKFLQDKKRNAELHKNEDAKNYFTCNDTSIKNLGFLEFTDVYYVDEIDSYNLDNSLKDNVKTIIVHFYSIDKIIIDDNFKNESEIKLINTISALGAKLDELKNENGNIEICLMFNPKLTFQDYITVKSQILKLESEDFAIDKNEIVIDYD
ncbi:hypothetical protein WNY78_16555 [Psychroserpens sp. AS72]|uniref:hypothetical protein n=1 Tax=Psychroserpens sp. AS72 TaxID=3135775 RepID=UPI00317B33F8